MKILIISQYFYPENFRINDFAFKMVERGHDVSVLTGVPNYPEGNFFTGYKSFTKEHINGVEVHRVPILARGNSRGYELAINYASYLLSSIIFGPFLLLKFRPDVIFSINYSPATVGLVGIFFSKIKKAPMYLWVQDLWPDSLIATGAVRSNFIINIIGLMVKWIYKKSDLIFVQSKSFGKSISSINSSFQKKISYLPNWAEDSYDLDSNLPQNRFQKLLPKDKFIIMFAGNLGVAQSLDTILLAASRLKKTKIHWVFLGDGRQKEWLKRSLVDYGLQDNISILGRYPMTDMPKFFNLADILLVTLKKDLSYSMTIPGKIQSYLKAGKPILSSLDGEGAEVIQESISGLNVESEDFIGLANAALKMSELSKESLSQMGINGKKYYDKNFDVNSILSTFENAYKTQCGKDFLDI